MFQWKEFHLQKATCFWLTDVKIICASHSHWSILRQIPIPKITYEKNHAQKGQLISTQRWREHLVSPLLFDDSTTTLIGQLIIGWCATKLEELQTKAVLFVISSAEWTFWSREEFKKNGAEMIGWHSRSGKNARWFYFDQIYSFETSLIRRAFLKAQR